MKYLLPHHFKKTGLIIAPLGLFVWLCIQFGLFSQLLAHLSSNEEYSGVFRSLTFIIAALSLLGFLLGLIFISFSKEKVEDEMIQRIRVESFQIAALVQILFVFSIFTGMIIFGSPNEGLLMLFFIISLALFWVTFILRFSYRLYFRLGHG